MLFALPVTAAVATSVRLGRQRAVLEEKLALESTTLDRLNSAMQQRARRQEQLEAEVSALTQELDRLEQKLTPEARSWSRLLLKAALLPSRLEPVGESRPRGGAGTYPVQNSSDRPYFPQLMGDPAYARVVAILVRQEVEKNYGRLLDELALDPSKQAALEELLTQRMLAREDAAGLLGPGVPDVERFAAKAETVQSVNAAIRAAFGPQVWQQVRAYDGLYRYYGVLDELQAQLSYTTAPLQAVQYNQVAGLLVRALGPRMTTVYWAVPDEVMTQAQSILAPGQIEALQRIQVLQRANIRDRDARERNQAGLSRPPPS